VIRITSKSPGQWLRAGFEKVEDFIHLTFPIEAGAHWLRWISTLYQRIRSFLTIDPDEPPKIEVYPELSLSFVPLSSLSVQSDHLSTNNPIETECPLYTRSLISRQGKKATDSLINRRKSLAAINYF